MQKLQRRPAPCRTLSSPVADVVFYSVDINSRCLDSVLYRVVPAGKDFFHILEIPSGRIKGFRRGHNQACALARELEAMMYRPVD
ncbi:hypothetical protein [Pseudomonas mucidolens]|uniref:Uncharacterized protein n=1 Tax=Pseudomonas mucidolens TaxID=46679 RepID=A0A1H2MFV7_9PSED|nr:hypothetical protein [Pseudomonas mucidolens]SDU91801.1 hypothetical protein SAMN05216202_1597 [Pseudomonas mucidolens]SQH33990.1 Uncharacterised protein [Pseudomonas mucidolens]